MAFSITSIATLDALPGTVALALGGITVGGRKGGTAATIETTEDPGASSSGRAFADGRPITLGVSRLDDEEQWILDSLTIGSFPVFANGVGSRCTLLKALTDAEMVAALDAAAAELA